MGSLFRKQLSEVGKRLEFKGIARWVEEEQSRLFTGQALEPDMGLNDKFCTDRGELVRQSLPFRHRQHDPKVPHGHLIAIDHIGRVQSTLIGRQVRHNLMTKEIKVDPFG